MLLSAQEWFDLEMAVYRTELAAYEDYYRSYPGSPINIHKPEPPMPLALRYNAPEEQRRRPRRDVYAHGHERKTRGKR